jgi:two-component system response regulator FixJ
MNVHSPARRAYIVDDEPRLRALVRQALRGSGIDVEEFGSSESFLDGHRRRPPGCIIVDIGLPGIDGLDMLETIARDGAVNPAVVLSGIGTVPSAVRAGRLGVVDFIEKPFRIADLIAAVEKALDQLRSAASGPAGALASLSARERQVLIAFADGAPNKTVAHQLGLSVRTIEFYRANLVRKLGVRNLTQALFLARDGGYL